MTDIKVTLRRAASIEAARRIPFAQIAKLILGDKYELSLVVCGDELAQRMNKTYRKKSYFPNVLSFPLEKTAGEIFLNVRKAERESREFGVKLHSRLAYLFVHGCFHLKGMDHGDRMEKEEAAIMRKFKLA